MTGANVVPLALSSTRAIEIIRRVAEGGGKVIFTHHADKRMKERKIDRGQVLGCLKKGRIIEAPHRDIGTGNWQCTLERYSSGQTVTVPVAIKFGPDGELIIIITVY